MVHQSMARVHGRRKAVRYRRVAGRLGMVATVVMVGYFVQCGEQGILHGGVADTGRMCVCHGQVVIQGDWRWSGGNLYAVTGGLVMAAYSTDCHGTGLSY